MIDFCQSIGDRSCVKLLFGEKIGGNSETENNSTKRINDGIEPFSFNALHFLRNRLMPNGKN